MKRVHRSRVQPFDLAWPGRWVLAVNYRHGRRRPVSVDLARVTVRHEPGPDGWGWLTPHYDNIHRGVPLRQLPWLLRRGVKAPVEG